MMTILFVCVHNSGRSQMAEAFLNKLATGRVRAISAGTEPAEAVNPMVVKVMSELGIDISHQKPKKLTLEMIEQADKVITMGCGVDEVCPGTFVETEDWGIDDPRGKPLQKVREIRDQIQVRVSGLLTEISYRLLLPGGVGVQGLVIGDEPGLPG